MTVTSVVTCGIVLTMSFLKISIIYISVSLGRFIDREHTAIYILTLPDETFAFQLQKEEVEQVKWIDVEELVENLRRKVRFYRVTMTIAGVSVLLIK